MASILDEYEDSLSRSAVLQPGCPNVGIPHSGKGGEGAAAHLSSPGTCMWEEWGGGLQKLWFTSWTCSPGLGP